MKIRNDHPDRPMPSISPNPPPEKKKFPTDSINKKLIESASQRPASIKQFKVEILNDSEESNKISQLAKQHFNPTKKV